MHEYGADENDEYGADRNDADDHQIDADENDEGFQPENQPMPDFWYPSSYGGHQPESSVKPVVPVLQPRIHRR